MIGLRLLLASGAIAVAPVLSRVVPEVLTTSRGHTLGYGAAFAAMALSLNIVAGHAGQLTLGHGAVLSAGAVTSGVVTARYEQPFVVGVVAAAAVTALLSMVVLLPALRLRALALGAATLGLSLAVEASLFRWDWLTSGAEGIVLPRPLAGTFRFSASADFAAVAVGLALLVWAVDGRIARSRVGRGMHAVREDERFATACGVDVTATKLQAFLLSGLTAGIAGAAYGHLLITVGPSTFGYSTLSLPLFAMVVIAGQGSRGAVTAVAFGYAVLPRALRFLDAWAQITGAVLFLNAVVRNPDGVAGTLRRKRRAGRLRQSGTAPAAPSFRTDSIRVTSPSADTCLELDDVHVAIGGAQIVRGLSMRVPAGAIVAVVGPNGAGKTTLLDTVAGLRTTSAGSVRMFGVDVTRESPRARGELGLARTLQSGGLPRRLDLLEVLLLAQHLHDRRPWPEELLGSGRSRRTERAMRDRAVSVATALGFGDRLDSPIEELSIGQQRIVELGAALLTDAPLLLLDEPSAGLAPGAVESLAETLRVLRDDLGRSIVLVEHNLSLVRQTADIVYVVGDGRVVHHGSAAELSARDDVLRAWLGGVAA